MKIRALTLVLIISLIGCLSCRKTTKTIGNNLEPTNNYIVDTIWFNDQDNITTSTFTVPSLSTKQLGYAFIGNMNDPVFGNSNFDFYTQLSLSTSSLSWGENAVADSIYLDICYNGYYGDTTDKQLTLRIFEIAEDMFADSTYKSNMVLQCESENLTEETDFTFVPRPLTPVDTIIDRGVLHIPMSMSLAEKLMSNEYAADTVFKSFFKGLHLVCDKDDIAASAVSFNLTHSYSYLRLYYHDEADTVMKYDFKVTSSDVRFNHYTHDYSNSEITFNDTTSNQKLYVQGAAGTRVWVKFPNIQQWADSLDGNVIINEAKLVLNGAVDADTNFYAPPTKLVAAAAKFDTDTTYVILPDQLVSSDYFGGYYNNTDRNVWFRITEYIQNLIQNGTYATDCNGILLYVDQGSLVPHRWAFHGPGSNSADDRMSLRIVYSIVKD